MSITWLVPAALAGAALIALPIAIHLLVRQHTRTLAYPSLRFVRETQLAAFRRRSIEDAALLLVRVALIAIAAAALAGPILQTAARDRDDASRISRAIVEIGAAAVDATPLKADVFASRSFRRAETADAIAGAVRWLAQQPRSAREIVFAGDLRERTIDEALLAAVPAEVGIRFEQKGSAASNLVQVPILARRNGALVRIDRAATLTGDSTEVVDGPATPVADDLVRIVAGAQESALASAALRAALSDGVTWRDFDRRVVIAWEGVDASAISPAGTNPLVIRMPVPAPVSSAADAVRAALAEASPMPHIEPSLVPQERLAAWSRPAGAPQADAKPADHGDRRWLWAVVLLLFGVEWMMRRRSQAEAEPSQVEEARVA